MDDRILLNPDNRALGSSGANDFSLYGAQPEPAVRIGPADDEKLVDPLAAAATASPAAASPTEAAPTENAISGDAPAAPAVPAPNVAPAEPVVQAPAEAAQTTAEPSPSDFSGASSGFAPTQAPLNISPLVPASSGSLEAPLVSPAAASGISAPTIETTLGTIDAASTEAPAAVTQAVALAEDATVLADDAAQVALGAAQGITEGAADDVQDLLGSDPAGGIATLVSLVSISDVMDLREAGNEQGEASEDPALLMLDTLAADLTDTAPDDDQSDDSDDALLPIAPMPVADDLTDPLG